MPHKVMHAILDILRNQYFQGGSGLAGKASYVRSPRSHFPQTDCRFQKETHAKVCLKDIHQEGSCSSRTMNKCRNIKDLHVETFSV